jgi:hypothetical protein
MHPPKHDLTVDPQQVRDVPSRSPASKPRFRQRNHIGIPRDLRAIGRGISNRQIGFRQDFGVRLA